MFGVSGIDGFVMTIKAGLFEMVIVSFYGAEKVKMAFVILLTFYIEKDEL